MNLETPDILHHQAYCPDWHYPGEPSVGNLRRSSNLQQVKQQMVYDVQQMMSLYSMVCPQLQWRPGSKKYSHCGMKCQKNPQVFICLLVYQHFEPFSLSPTNMLPPCNIMFYGLQVSHPHLYSSEDFNQRATGSSHANGQSSSLTSFDKNAFQPSNYMHVSSDYDTQGQVSYCISDILYDQYNTI